ncbi:S9 family peptidase [Rothia sp. ZJ1223]|uniref:alpha/beta hydrolase family protein n=1 Tax=Rothia sp. ZJ1223 TaxID=2811098 RepID=UPI00195B2B4F|nr:alpha/beta fold hydrolase [Rothia sp. ZJ1223]MBM7050685.1 alpha/beta fold hydrolase [Rothia sp. ZJ1223]
MNKISEHLHPQPETRTWLKGASTGAVIGAGIATTAALGSTALATYFARQIVVPPKRPVENLKILGVGYSHATPSEGEQPNSVRLPATCQTQIPGTYGLYFNAGTSFAVIGEIIAHSPLESSVLREVMSVHNGDLAQATRGRWSGVVAPTPELAGYKSEEIFLELPVGSAPAWLVRPNASTEASAPSAPASKTWAIMVHGMGAKRTETLRALRTTQALGMISLHMSYRNDREAPPSDDGRYGLGFTEWEDVETAIDYALEHGAHDVVLFGWSMGGAISLQTADRARNKQHIRALILNGPAVDWLSLIEYHSNLNKLPLRIGELGVRMISKPRWSSFTGLKAPIELERLSWTRRAKDLRVPTLIMHSVKDDFVPVAPAIELARRSPHVDLVTFPEGSHTKEWNVNPERWHRAVMQWLEPRMK